VTRAAGPARVVVTADDLGLHPALNAGIMKAHDEGIVTSVSLCSHGPAFAQAAALCRARPALECGAHLALTDGIPVLPPGQVPSLVDGSGRLRRSWTGLLRDAVLGRIRLAEVEAEWRAQLRKLRDAGLAPRHLNSHQHVHLLPPFFSVARKLAAESGIAHIRLPAMSAAWDGGPAGIRRDLCVAAAGWLCRRGGGPSVPCHGIPYSGRLTAARLAACLRAAALSGAGELLCHPGDSDEALDKDLGWRYHWSDELALLTHPGAKESLRAAQVRLCRFGEL
jgi:predicted glycoside hydrolase/deacetylase ChbG (UPF0249 family)